MERISDTTIDKTHYWCPPVPALIPQKRKVNSSLRIGAIVSTRLYDGLRYEGQLFLLTPDNWKQILLVAGIDLLIVESCFISATGDWYFSQVLDNAEHATLIKLIKYANELNIPTVFWNTQDQLYHHHYNNLADCFDFVFCADVYEAEALKKEKIDAAILPPAVQPVLHNPFKAIADADDFEIPVLFDGWADLARLGEKLAFIKDLFPYGLKIIESRARLLHVKLSEIPDYRQYILGCVTREAKRTALKHSGTLVTSEQSIVSPTEQQWMAIEAAAFRLPVLYMGALHDVDIRKGICSTLQSRTELLSLVRHYRENPFKREKDAHLAWRKVMSRHTYSHRLQTICKTVGLTHDWQEFPSITMITPTFRPDLVNRCIDNFDKQKYPNKELVLVVNTDRKNPRESVGREINNKKISVVAVPAENFVGTCLNMGAAIADGDYCVRVDDDDHYGRHCLADIMLHGRAIDFDLFGKPTQYFSFENDPGIYNRAFRLPALTVIPRKKLANVHFHVAGNLLGGKTKLFRKRGYSDMSLGAADSCFLLDKENARIKYCCLDGFNLLIFRSSNEKMHTWKLKKEKILAVSKLLAELTIDDLDF